MSDDMLTVGDLVAELALVRGLLRGLVEAVTETSPQVCWFCPGDDPTRHAPTCPWRQAAEYIQSLEVGE